MRLGLPLVVALLLAGCLDPLTERLRAGEVEEPRWSVGDWWTFELTSDVYATESTVTVVVANTTPEGYVLGTPVGDDATFALLQHLPPIGPVRRDLAWDVHEQRFEPLRFPLEDGAEWDATWISTTVHLTARLHDGTWNVTNEGYENESRMRYDITYDPAAGWFTKFVRTGLDGRVQQSLVLVENGTGYVGDVRTIGNVQVALMEARSRGALSGGLPAAPNPRFVVPEGADTLLVGCLAGGQPGQYHAEVRSPTGVVCQLDESIPPGDTLVRAQVVEAPAEEGEWEARLAAVGQGNAIAEVLAYPTDVVTLG